MENKMTIEDLEKQCLEAEKNYQDLYELLAQAKKKEEEAKREKLEHQKEQRLEEIKAVSKHLNELYKSYIEDYGYIKMEYKTDDYDWFPSFWKHNFWF
jgi:uncharacterized FlaG/YvyC family protein